MSSLPGGYPRGRPASAWPPPPAGTGWAPAGSQPSWPGRQGWSGPPVGPRAPQGRYAPPPPYRTPPPRRGGWLSSVLRLVLVIAAILFVASIVRGMLDPDPAPSDPTGGQVDTTSGSGAYVNEDYTPPAADLNPPPVPGPRNLDAATSLVTRNPLYDQVVLSPTNCEMGSLDMLRADSAEMEEHLNELMGCLMRVFEEPIVTAGFEMPRPPVTVYDRPIRTACGDFNEVNAAYCTGDQRVYYAQPLLEAFPSEVSSTPYAAEMIIAHEFGHAVQARTAILISEKVLEQRARSEAAALDLSRRTEVQADCLAGLYVGSVAQSQGLDTDDVTRLRELAYNLGDDVLSGRPGFSGGHGTGRAREDWFGRGVSTTDIGVCNSFIADVAEVR